MKKIPNKIGSFVIERMEDLKKRFIEIAPSVTSEMIAAIVIKLTTSDDTVKRYLKGNVARLEFGEKMYKELKRQVEKVQTSAIAS